MRVMIESDKILHWRKNGFLGVRKIILIGLRVQINHDREKDKSSVIHRIRAEETKGMFYHMSGSQVQRRALMEGCGLYFKNTLMTICCNTS